MKKYVFMAGCVVFGLLLGFMNVLQAQVSISKTISFSKEEIILKQESKKGRVFEKVFIKKCHHSAETGKPVLPYKCYTFYIPDGQSVTDVIFSPVETEEITLDNKIIPGQLPVPTSIENSNDTAFNEPDSKVYGADIYYPEKQANIGQVNYFDYDIGLLTITICPVQYNPVANKLKLYTQATITLVTTISGEKTLGIKKASGHDKWHLDMIKTIVENPQDVPEPSIYTVGTGIKSSLKSGQVNWSVPFYEYVIVTSRALKPAFAEFVAWKKRKGYYAGIVCIDSIIYDGAAANGDTVSNLNDSAGKLRQYLNMGCSAGIIKYALLGGDYNIVPIRYGYGGEYFAAAPNYMTWANGGAKIPADLYFSDFNTNWNYYNNDTLIGKYYNGFQYGPEIFVGRLMCNSESDIKTWTAKVLKYEQNPGNGDYSYLSKWMATQADELQARDEAGVLESFLPSMFTTKTKLSENPSYNSLWPTNPKGAYVINYLNQRYGFFSIFNHGSPHGFGTATHSDSTGKPIYDLAVHFNVNAVDDYDNHDEYVGMYSAIPEPGNGFDNLTNNNYPTLVYSVSCLNMPFDDYKTDPGTRNLAEGFMCMFSGGGPAYLGNTRVGWVSISNLFANDFMDKISNGFVNIGKAEAYSKSISGYLNADYYRWVKLSHNLAGCPETPMWTASPTIFSGAGVTEYNNDATVYTGGTTGAKLCVMSAIDNGASYFKDTTIDQQSYTFSNVTKPYYVTITKDNYIPYMLNPTDVYIQNKTLSSLTYLTCTSVSAGFIVDPSQGTGNVVIQNGANVTFDASGNILLDKGFEVKLGAYFEAK